MTALARHVNRLVTILTLALVAAIATGLHLAAQDDAPLWHETEAINPGLDAPPEDVDRSSPRVALRSFLKLAETGDFEAAAHVLNLSKFPQDAQAAEGAERAAKLAAIIDRKIWINWSGIPPEPDARASENDENGAQPRRDYLLEEFEVDGHIYAVRLGRYAADVSDGKADDPVWLFSSDTVDSTDILYDAFGPRAFEGYIPDALKAKFGWLRIWEWIALPLLIAGVILVTRTTSKFIRLGRHISDERVLRLAFERAALPLSLVIASFVAQWLLGFVVSFSGPVTTVLTPTLVMVAVVGFSLAALRIVDALLDRVTRRYLGDKYDAPNSSEREFYTSIYALRRLILVITIGFSVVFVVMQFDIFADMGITLLASAGVLTVILGIAGQATLGNMVASLQIAIAKPVRIGDSIHYEGDWCIVEAIFFTFIRLRTWDERRIIVPVKFFLSSPFRNWSVVDERMLCTIRLVLDPMAEVAVLRERFNAIAQSDPEVIESEKLGTYVIDLSSRGLTVEFYVMASDPSAAWTVEVRLREELVNFIRREHPDWWWRQPILENGR